MKRKLFVISMFICVCQLSMAQEPRPDWVRNTPFPPADANYIFVYGMGIGVTEQEAEFSAWKNALYKALNEGGLVGIKAQSKTLEQIFTMEDLETMLLDNLLQWRLTCQTLPIYLSEKDVKVYILLQVQRDNSRSVDFYSHDLNFIKCETDDFLQELKEYNKREIDKRKIERENAEKLKGANALFASGKLVLKNGRELKENEVRTLFANSKSYQLYNSGIGLRKSAVILFWTGLIVGVVVGVPLIGTGYGESGETKTGQIGLYILGGGITVGLISGICYISGNKKISNAVELYNNGKLYSSLPVELNFGLTQNGLGIVLNF